MEKIIQPLWEMYTIFENPIDGSLIRFWGKPLPLPDGVDELFRENWDNELKPKHSISWTYTWDQYFCKGIR